VSRLLDALRHLQQPSDVKRGPGVEKVTPRLAASIRRAVLANRRRLRHNRLRAHRE
jgi:hypothetical protein